jgi:hypothetical protein
MTGSVGAGRRWGRPAVRLGAGLAVALGLLAGCSSGYPVDPGSDRSAEPGESFTLKVGETVAIPDADLTVRLVAIMGDSRCPVDVTCVWAGDAVVAIEAVLSGAEYAFGLHVNPGTVTGPAHADVGAYRIQLEGLAPDAYAGVPIPQADYTVTLRIDPLP